eukprot:1940993-Alexandrium_andersonii.AAC.1
MLAPPRVTAGPALVAEPDTKPTQELRGRSGPSGGFPRQAARATRRTVPRHARAEPAHVPNYARRAWRGQELSRRRFLPRARGGWVLTQEARTPLQLRPV